MRKVQGYKQPNGNWTIVAKALWRGRRVTAIRSDAPLQLVKAKTAEAIAETDDPYVQPEPG